MARPLRMVFPGQPHHMVQRGNNRCAVFSCDEDREYYLRVLRESSQRANCAIHSYALMPNHVHVVASPEEKDGLSRMFQMIGRRYVRYYNELHERTGTLWENRFWSAAIDSASYFFRCSRYVETNALRAGLAAEPESYRWSSARRNLLGFADNVVTQHPLYLSLGARPVDCQKNYREMFTAQLDDHSLEVIRRATRRNGRVTTAETRLVLETTVRRRLLAGMATP